jgi:uncharacterized protein with HEPN domain
VTDAPSRDHTYLGHMLAAIERIRRYVGRKGRATFLRNALLQDAVIRNIEIVGEAAGRVSTETTSRTPEVPWREIVGMRHRLIHGYLEVNLNTVWRVVARDLPALERTLRALVEPSRLSTVKRTGRKRASKTPRAKPRRAN